MDAKSITASQLLGRLRSECKPGAGCRFADCGAARGAGAEKNRPRVVSHSVVGQSGARGVVTATCQRPAHNEHEDVKDGRGRGGHLAQPSGTRRHGFGCDAGAGVGGFG
eukprot:1131467-Prymnesium_polylepis.2